VACRSMITDAAAGAAAPAIRKVVSLQICRVSSQVQLLSNKCRLTVLCCQLVTAKGLHHRSERNWSL
jgi:hypothetical protein